LSEIGFPYYVWLLAGLALCAAETLVPGAFLIWIGAAGLIVGAVEFFAPMPLTVQALGFAALVVALVFVGRRVYGSVDAVGPSLPMSRAHALMGKEFFLNEAIARGFGTIRVDDSVWRVAGEDMPTGTRVRVIAIEDGSAIRVEKAIRLDKD
jgi:inner membrane protein